MRETNSGKKARKINSHKNGEVPKFDYAFNKVKPITIAQNRYTEAIRNNSIVFGIGSAGTGKTFLAVNYASELLWNKSIDKIIITRPNVEVGKSLGYLPGELEEKYAPYLEPFNECFNKFLGKGFYDYCIRTKTIEPIPIGFMRGRSFENTIILADEMQNATPQDMLMFLSRIGKNSKIIISGDPLQCDIPKSGLLDAASRLRNIKGIEVVEFSHEDIVRSTLCKQIILAYNNLY